MIKLCYEMLLTNSKYYGMMTITTIVEREAGI